MDGCIIVAKVLEQLSDDVDRRLYLIVHSLLLWLFLLSTNDDLIRNSSQGFVFSCSSILSVCVSLRFNGHFPGEHGLAGLY